MSLQTRITERVGKDLHRMKQQEELQRHKQNTYKKYQIKILVTVSYFIFPLETEFSKIKKKKN